MPGSQHQETDFAATATVRDIVIGMADGLTVPFALAAGISGAIASNRIVVVAGLAEIAAGSIAMGLGGYLAARTDAEHYQSELRREYRETDDLPEEEAEEVARVFRGGSDRRHCRGRGVWDRAGDRALEDSAWARQGFSPQRRRGPQRAAEETRAIGH